MNVVGHQCQTNYSDIVLADKGTKQSEINQTVKYVVKKQKAIDRPLITMVNDTRIKFSISTFHSSK